jgi:AcrR family transcriptional regulator
MPRIRAASIDEHKALTRSAVLGAAKRLIEDAGTADLPLGDIATVAGIGRTTLYDYFSDRDDLIATLVEQELPGVLQGLLDSLPAQDRPADRLATLAERTVEFVVNDPVLGVILHREVGRMGPSAEVRIRAAHANLAEAMLGLYQAGVAAGEFRLMPPDLAGRWIQDTIMSAARTVLSSARPSERVHQVTAHLRLFLLGGLSATRST